MFLNDLSYFKSIINENQQDCTCLKGAVRELFKTTAEYSVKF